MATTQTLTTSTASPLPSHDQPLEKEDPHQFPNLPPFPQNIPTAPLHILTLSSLRSSPSETSRLFEASHTLGFFYLDLRGDPEGEILLREADQFFDVVAPQLFDLGREELERYDYSGMGSYAGYKGYGASVADELGRRDRNEFYNIPKDDFLSISPTPFAHPQILHNKKSLITSFTHNSHTLCTLLLNHLNTHLHLPPLTLQNLHKLANPSGDQIRLIKAPPQPPSDLRTSLGKHTDFGSLTLLFNRLGGLQILPPPSLIPEGQKAEWTYVKPLPGHCIVNLGDAMSKFTRGVLRSNIHRVVSPPGEQAEYERWSVVYFMRPGDDVALKPLESDAIPKTEGKKMGGDIEDGYGGKGEEEEEEEEMTAKEWILLQALRLRGKAGRGNGVNEYGKGKGIDEMSGEERKKLWDASGRGI